MKREPAVAGRFYPRDPQALKDEIKSHIDETAEKNSAIGVVAPHAGFKYSGDVAGSVYSRLEIPETVVLLGPNHTGMGERISLMAKGTWTMPFGARRTQIKPPKSSLYKCEMWQIFRSATC